MARDIIMETLVIEPGSEYAIWSKTSENVMLGVCHVQKSSIRKLVIGEGVVQIGTMDARKGMFYRCYALREVVLPSSLQSIGRCVFQECIKLTGIVIPEGCRKIGEGAFDGCWALTKVTFQEGCASIGNGAFEDCHALLDVKLPESIQKIGNYAFRGCVCLTPMVYNWGKTCFRQLAKS